MIKVDNREVEYSGDVLTLVIEFSIIASEMIKALSEHMDMDNAVNVLKDAINVGRKAAN